MPAQPTQVSSFNTMFLSVVYPMRVAPRAVVKAATKDLDPGSERPLA